MQSSETSDKRVCLNPSMQSTANKSVQFINGHLVLTCIPLSTYQLGLQVGLWEIFEWPCIQSQLCTGTV
jgi:hypothetical protein